MLAERFILKKADQLLEDAGFTAESFEAELERRVSARFPHELCNFFNPPFRN